MTTKDWILLLVPLFANLIIDGVLVFFLKMLLERNVRIRKIKAEYVDKIRSMTDDALHYSAEALKRKNRTQFVENCKKCFDICTDIYFYAFENIENLSKLSNYITKIHDVISKIEIEDGEKLDLAYLATTMNELIKSLSKLKMACIKY